jgi:uncharacterized membrane protein HdeD (DUF308 family)
MDKVRGILMLVVGGFALYRGVVMQASGVRTHQSAWAAIVLGLVAIALGIWRLTRKPPRRLV